MALTKPLDTSSGDIHADRRADYAEMLLANGERVSAAEVMLGALELAPGWAFGWFRLGELQEAAGQVPAAVEAWRMAQGLDPEDHAGAALKLALIGADQPPDRPPSAFVEALFDQYASRFDKALVQSLDYRVPDLLLDAILHAGPSHFPLALDLGCGTGLMGEKLRPIVGTLIGYDISTAMLAQARAKNVYDRLEKADLQDLPFAATGADLVSAADVFMYCGRLDNIFAGIAAMLKPDALFAFSVEAYDGPEDFRLCDTRRYAHSEAYVRSCVAGVGLRLVESVSTNIRQDRGLPVSGLIVTARKD